MRNLNHIRKFKFKYRRVMLEDISHDYNLVKALTKKNYEKIIICHQIFN